MLEVCFIFFDQRHQKVPLEPNIENPIHLLSVPQMRRFLSWLHGRYEFLFPAQSSGLVIDSGKSIPSGEN